jgi:hypothetical protein
MGSFFDISFATLNLFSFILGGLWAIFSSYGWYGKRDVWGTIVLYFAGLALYYYLKLQYGT